MEMCMTQPSCRVLRLTTVDALSTQLAWEVFGVKLKQAVPQPRL